MSHALSLPSSSEPKVFDEFTCWYTGGAIPVTSYEHPYLDHSARAYPTFARQVETLQHAAERHAAGMSHPDDPHPYYQDGGALRYDLESEGRRYTVSLYGGDKRQDITQMRAYILARARGCAIPHLQALVAHSIPDSAIVALRPKGVLSSELTPDAIDTRFARRFLVKLRGTALTMGQAGLALNIDWDAEGPNGEESFRRVVSYVDDDPRSDRGPVFFDIIAHEEDSPDRNHDPRQIYAELITSMIATGTKLSPEAVCTWPYSEQAIKARLRFLDLGHNILSIGGRYMPAVEWLKRTADRLIEVLPEEQQSFQRSLHDITK